MANALENFVNSVRTLSASGNFRDLADHLNETIELLSRNWNYLDNVLETLDIQQHSLGILYVLIAKFNSMSISNEEPTRLLLLFKEFINQCNGEQVRFATHAYYESCHLFANMIVDTPACIVGIKILATAIEKIRLFESQLTPVHSDLCQLSLKARYFKFAHKFLDIDITSISTGAETRASSSSDANYDSKFFLLYYYYGGMIYTAAKNFDRALYFFEVCMSSPAMALSHIMLEAYKKFILVSLIISEKPGCEKVSPVPKYTSQLATRFMRPHVQIYLDLAAAFATSIIDEYSAVVTKYTENFNRDKNMGLVKQALSSMYKRNIQRLTRTFRTLSLADVATRAQLPDSAQAERFILKMIKYREIYATIDQKDNMVTFKSDPENYNSHVMFLELQQDMEIVVELVKQINKMEEEILLNPIYIKKISHNQEDETTSQTVKTFPASEQPTD